MYKQPKTAERPNPLRSKIVENYMDEILSSKQQDVSDMETKLNVIKKMIKYHMDNRILNNLRQ